MNGWWIIAILFFGLAVGLLVFAVIMLVLPSGQDARIDSFSQHCTEASGHIYKPDVTSWCLSTDGRILEVYP